MRMTLTWIIYQLMTLVLSMMKVIGPYINVHVADLQLPLMGLQIPIKRAIFHTLQHRGQTKVMETYMSKPRISFMSNKKIILKAYN